MNPEAMTPEQLFNDGKAAFRLGAPATDCPYTFDKSKFWMSKDYNGFHTVRWKMDSWMKGWIEAQREQRNAT